MAQTVIGFFEDIADAQHAIERLEHLGISRKDIDLSKGTGTANSTLDRDKDTGNRGNGVSGFFNSLFGNNTEEADRYAKMGNSGYSIVTVHAQSRDLAEQAADLLDECGAVDIDERAMQAGYGKQNNDIIAGQQHIAGNQDRSTSINRIQENLEIEKRTVEQGGVRVRSRIVERPVEEQVRLREEKVHVERQQVDRPVSATELNHFQEGDLVLTERAEVPIVNKQARVVEEIKIRKDITERDQVVRDTVRNTEVDVEDINRNDNRQDFNNNNPNNTRTTF